MLLVGKTSVDEVEKIDAENIEYHPIKSEDLWKVDVIREILEVKCRKLEIDDFNQDNLEDILTYLCTSQIAFSYILSPYLNPCLTWSLKYNTYIYIY